MRAIEATLLLAATCLYVAHAASAVFRFLRPGRAGLLKRWGLPLGALVFHSSFLLARGLQAHGLPVETRLDSVALFLWLTTAAFVAVSRPYRLQGIAPLFWPLYAICMLGTWFLASRSPVDRPSLERTWLLLHLVPVYAGYAGFAIASGAGLAYLAQQRLLRRSGSDVLRRNLPSLEKLDRVGRAAVSLGFPLLTLGLVIGGFWAQHESELLGRVWYADPKVVAGIVVWLVYAAVLHIRLFANVNGRRAAVLTIACFLVTLATFAAAHVYPSSGIPQSSISVASPET